MPWSPVKEDGSSISNAKEYIKKCTVGYAADDIGLEFLKWLYTDADGVLIGKPWMTTYPKSEHPPTAYVFKKFKEWTELSTVREGFSISHNQFTATLAPLFAPVGVQIMPAAKHKDGEPRPAEFRHLTKDTLLKAILAQDPAFDASFEEHPDMDFTDVEEWELPPRKRHRDEDTES